MPSSVRRPARAATRRGKRRPDWFSQAAIERIAACASSGLGAPLQATEIVERYLTSDAAHGLVSQEFEDPQADEIFSLLHAPSLTFYTFAGLIELALDAGYVDLSNWPALARFELALRRFEQQEVKTEGFATDLTLVRDLLARLHEPRKGTDTLNPAAFFGFGSYLHLTSQVRSGAACKKFLQETAGQWNQPDDLAFLLSPQHFAEALATGRVAGFEVQAARGLETLRYFQWLTEILGRLPAAMQDKVIRHARWSHYVLQMRLRLIVWFERMQEWEVAAGLDMTDTATYLDDVLRPSLADLKRLDLLERAGPEIAGLAADLVVFDEHVFLDSKEQTVGRLLAEGRVGAARRELRKRAQTLTTVLRMDLSDDEQLQAVRRLVDTCAELEDAGDLAIAGVVLASHIERFATILEDDWRLEEVLALLKRARSPAVPADATTATAVVAGEPPAEAVALPTLPQVVAHPRIKSIGAEPDES